MSENSESKKEKKPTAKEVNVEFAKNEIANGNKVIYLDEKVKVKYLMDTRNFKKDAIREMSKLKANQFKAKKIVKIL